ncbi:hypothetical protein MaudCBS49596_000541 [Microsporum audouinii]
MFFSKTIAVCVIAACSALVSASPAPVITPKPCYTRTLSYRAAFCPATYTPPCDGPCFVAVTTSIPCPDKRCPTTKTVSVNYGCPTCTSVCPTVTKSCSASPTLGPTLTAS